MCAACSTPRLNQSYELRPPWEQHLRYVPHRVHNGYNIPTRLNAANYLRGLILGSTNRPSLLCALGLSLYQSQHTDAAIEFKRRRLVNRQMITNWGQTDVPWHLKSSISMSVHPHGSQRLTPDEYLTHTPPHTSSLVKIGPKKKKQRNLIWRPRYVYERLCSLCATRWCWRNILTSGFEYDRYLRSRIDV